MDIENWSKSKIIQEIYSMTGRIDRLKSINKELVGILERVNKMPIFLEGNDNALHYLIQSALQRAERERGNDERD